MAGVDPPYLAFLKGEYGITKMGWFKNYQDKYFTTGRFRPVLHVVGFIVTIGYLMEFGHIKRARDTRASKNKQPIRRRCWLPQPPLLPSVFLLSAPKACAQSPHGPLPLPPSPCSGSDSLPPCTLLCNEQTSATLSSGSTRWTRSRTLARPTTERRHRSDGALMRR